jgi:FMN phosphatase YigB (HAD superfamily)
MEYTGDWSSLCSQFEHSVGLDTGLYELAMKLKQRFQVHALSNAGAELERRLQHYGISELFGTVINSHRVKMAKPDQEIYRLTSELVKAKPEEILFVDDKYRNTRVAEMLGFQTHIYTTAKSFHKFLLAAGLIKASPPVLG